MQVGTASGAAFEGPLRIGTTSADAGALGFVCVHGRAGPPHSRPSSMSRSPPAPQTSMRAVHQIRRAYPTLCDPATLTNTPSLERPIRAQRRARAVDQPHGCTRHRRAQGRLHWRQAWSASLGWRHESFPDCIARR
jgi:hypothetical protein